LIHAAGESISGPVPEQTFAVVLEVQNEEELRNLHNKLNIGGVENTLITEIDAPYIGQATAIGITPTCNRGELKRYLSSLSLFGGKDM
jgi:hypothetical protein